MLGQHWVRFGVFGHVGRFTATEAQRYPRGARVVCRTRRGLEVGEVLSPTDAALADEPHGLLLRRVTVEDDLLLDRLEKNKDAAYRACQTKLEQRGLTAALVDVEHLFDGQSLFFYFLGDQSPVLEEITSELAETYEATVQFRKFTETLTAGCGPGCGTAEAENGCGTGACTSCAVVKACSTKSKSKTGEMPRI